MHVTIVYVHVKPEHVDDFIKASHKNHAASIKEPGNLRFDFIQQADDPSRFVFYEAYRSKDDVLAHKESQHYLNWRDTVNDWMAEPRKGVVYNGLYL